MKTGATADPPAAKRSKFRYVLPGGFLTLIAVVLLVPSMLDGRWLKATLERHVRESLHAEVRIESAEFSPWSGAARLGGIRVEGRSEGRDYSADVESADLRVELFPLLFRRLRVERVELSSPRVRYETLATGVAPPPMPSPWRIAEVVIRGGEVDYTLRRGPRPPFHARFTEIDYAGRDVSLASPLDLLRGAELSCQVDLGASARLVHRASQSPALSITALDLAQLDRRLDQSDALVLAGGVMDIFCHPRGGSTASVDVVVRDLKLDQNPGVPSGLFAFVPVHELQDYVDRGEGQLVLHFPLDLTGEPTMESLVARFWDGLWSAAVHRLAAQRVHNSLDHLQSGVRQFLLPTTRPNR